MAEPLCAYCRERPIDPRWRPFCSERCKMADLGRWLRGDYRVPEPSAAGPENTSANDNETDEG